MTPTIKVGSILIGKESPPMAEALALESDAYLGNWSVVKALDAFALDERIRAAGWHFFFLAAEVKVMFFGAIADQSIQKAVKRILEKVRPEKFNCLEVTSVVTKRFLGMPYVTLTAHSRHIQRSCQLDDFEQRQASQ
jgi:hypothetical protein